MEFRTSISRRIVLSFVVLTAVVSGLFGIGVTVAVDFFEEQLVSTEMEQEMTVLVSLPDAEIAPFLGEGSHFFREKGGAPDFLEGLEEGFSEVVLEEGAYHVFMVRQGEEIFYLVKDQTSFERREIFLKIIVFCGFLLSVGAAFILGRMTVKRIIAPIRRLTAQVRDREKMLVQTPPLASDYPDDEIGHLARTFDRTIGLLQQALQRESLFTSDISHELRTPLMKIQSSCDILLEKKDLDPYSLGRIHIIHRSVSDIRELVTAFLTLARHEKTALKQATLEDVVQSGLAEWKSRAEEKGISFLVERDAESTPIQKVLYPSALLHAVLSNLIANAVRHSDGGRILLRITSCGFELTDTGSGIGDFDKPSIFRPFFRGSSKDGEGIGLGLSLVQRICEREGWSVRVRDNHPSGCRFELSLDG